MDSFGLGNQKQTSSFNKRNQKKVFLHIKENAKRKNIYIDHINGYTDHVHCLVSMKAEQNIATVLQLIKGESSFWINKQNLTKVKFGWQDEYFAVSVGQSQLKSVRDYTKNQEIHHNKKTYAKEYDEFIEKYGFDIISK